MPPAAESRTRIVFGLFKELIDDRKKFSANAIGQEAVIANVAKIAVRNMSDKTGEEITNGQRDGCGGVGVVVEIFESDELAVIGFNAGFTEGRAFEIFAEIFDGGFAVVGLFVEMNHPCFLIEHVKP